MPANENIPKPSPHKTDATNQVEQLRAHVRWVLVQIEGEPSQEAQALCTRLNTLERRRLAQKHP